MKLYTLLILIAALTSSCVNSKTELFHNKVERLEQSQSKTLTDSDVSFRVITADNLSSKTGAEQATNINPNLKPLELILGFPVGLIGQQNIFGGTIIEISDPDAKWGNLKLAGLQPVHVRTLVNKEENKDKKALLLIGCNYNCSETSEKSVIYSIPIVSEKDGFLYLDLKSFGENLNIANEASLSSLGTLSSSEVTSVDFSLATLIFDVESIYQVDSEKELKVKTRWYLKLASSFSQEFERRTETEGVGYFTTSRGVNPLITRFSISSDQSPTAALIKYYLKAIPSQHQKAFADALEEWNTKISPLLNKNLIEYEFINSNDPRFDLIVTGDPRFNVIEWDLKNKADYGGLGPSIANQQSGEIFSANVLIQGPDIEKMYKKWWGIKEPQQAVELAKSILNSQKNHQKNKLAILSGDHRFQIAAYDPRLLDTVELDPLFFLEKPQGISFENYMYGYFREMVSHEVGHNLGLRHNFKGNLGATDDGSIGSVSRSIMEYLKRPHRHMNRIGEYDTMAIKYAYLGIEPEHKNWFCTDNEKAQAGTIYLSAECSADDATSIPFDYFIKMVKQGISFILAPETETAPQWSVDILRNDLTTYLNGIMNYAITADASGTTWTQFGKSKHISNPTDSPQKVVENVLEQLFCSDNFEKIVSSKLPTAKEMTRKNALDLRSFLESNLHSYTAYGNWAPKLSCVKTYIPPEVDPNSEY